jgi:hypothetical protein
MQSLGLSTTNLWFQAIISAFTNFFSIKNQSNTEEYKLLGKIELCIDNAQKTQEVLNNFNWEIPTKADFILLEKEATELLKQQSQFAKSIKQLSKQSTSENLTKAFKQLLSIEKKVALAIEDFLDEIDFLLDEEAQELLDKIHNNNLSDFEPYKPRA